MKLKRILAGVAAASVAVSALAVSAFAESFSVTEKPETTVIPGSALANAETVTVTISSDVEEVNHSNGCVGRNSLAQIEASGGDATKGWYADSWDLSKTDDGVVEIVVDVDDIPANEAGVKEDIQIQHWWFEYPYTVSYEIKEKDPDVGTTDFESGGVATDIIKADGGVVFKNNSDEYQLDVVNKTNDANLLGDEVTGVDNAKAIGVRFKVTDFNVGDPEMAVSLIANANTADGKNFYRWSDDEVNGVTVKSGKEDVATIKGNGEYIVWAVFDEAITYDESFLISLIGTLNESAPAAIADDEPVLPYTIEVLEVGVQEPDAEYTDPIPDDESSDNETSEPTPENPGDEPTPENPGDEPTTPGNCDGDPNKDNSSDDNNSGDNGNTSVDNGDDNNPGTGVALAVVPAVLAAGALATATIVLKKRK